MQRAHRLLEYFNYMVNCLGFFSSKNLNEIVHKNTCIHEQQENHFYCVREHQSLGKILLPTGLAQFFSEQIVLLHGVL